jgi:hypothetical protein
MDVDEEFNRIVGESVEALEPYLRRNIENLYRVGRLVGTATEPTHEDILRSAVVFLHATLEDCLRSVAAALLPKAGETAKSGAVGWKRQHSGRKILSRKTGNPPGQDGRRRDQGVRRRILTTCEL